MIRIFAKHMTTEKVLIYCLRDNVRDIQLMLAEKYGGSWLLVDQLHTLNEFLKFDDGLMYRGFHGKNERYCKSIVTHKI